MIYKWSDAVKQTGKLTVFNGMAVGQWSAVFAAALASFNKNSGLSIKLEETKSREDANIIMLLTSEKDGILSTLTHGRTRMYRDQAGGQILQVETYLPSEPKENHPNYLRFIAVHELVHACGLDDAEHANDGAFMTLPNFRNGKIFAQAGSKQMPPLFLSSKTRSKLASAW